MAKHISREERHVLSAYLKDGLSLRGIANKLKRSVSSISDEVSINGGQGTYDPDAAHFNAQLRKWNANRRNPMKNIEVWDYVLLKLQEGLSPEQIAGRMRTDYPDNKKMRISHETIYVFVNSPEGRTLDLAKSLRRKNFRKLRKGRLESTAPKKVKIPNRIPITKRPKIVENKKRYGDWESDLMEGRRGTKAVLCVQKERKSQYVCLKKISAKTSGENNRAIKLNLSVFPKEILRTITYDNGSENVNHEEINRLFRMLSFFCDAYASWQKGGVENIIGLVREYLPKGTDLSKVSDREIQAIQDKLNNRPRKCLGYLTPNEVLSKYLKKLGVRFPA